MVEEAWSFTKVEEAWSCRRGKEAWSCSREKRRGQAVLIGGPIVII